MGIKLSKQALEEYLFDNKVSIRHIEYDHETDEIKIILGGSQMPEQVEASTVMYYELQNAIHQIKQCLNSQD